MADLEHALSRLKRGLMTDNERVALVSYKELYQAGPRVSQIVERELDRLDLKAPLRLEAMALFAGLVALHRDIDEARSNAFIDDKLTQCLPPLTTAILRSARRMEGRAFKKSVHQGVEILEHISLHEAYRASDLTRSWLSDLPLKDIEGISRIYIVPEDFSRDWMGNYLPVLSVVTLAWTTSIPPNSRFIFFTNILHRRVLLHEIGHHVHKHWFGQDPEQEREADAYASRSEFKAMPVWARTARAAFATTLRLLRPPMW